MSVNHIRVNLTSATIDACKAGLIERYREAVEVARRHESNVIYCGPDRNSQLSEEGLQNAVVAMEESHKAMRIISILDWLQGEVEPNYGNWKADELLADINRRLDEIKTPDEVMHDVALDAVMLWESILDDEFYDWFPGDGNIAKQENALNCINALHRTWENARIHHGYEEPFDFEFIPAFLRWCKVHEVSVEHMSDIASRKAAEEISVAAEKTRELNRCCHITGEHGTITARIADGKIINLAKNLESEDPEAYHSYRYVGFKEWKEFYGVDEVPSNLDIHDVLITDANNVQIPPARHGQSNGYQKEMEFICASDLIPDDIRKRFWELFMEEHSGKVVPTPGDIRIMQLVTAGVFLELYTKAVDGMPQAAYIRLGCCPDAEQAFRAKLIDTPDDALILLDY